MQLRAGTTRRISATLGALTASLLAVSGAHAQTSPVVTTTTTERGRAGLDDETYTDEGMTRVDTAVLVYQEDGGRVRAIEPMLGVTLNGDNGRVLSMHLTADTLTGATPNGATPWRQLQTFTTPTEISGPTTSTTVTSASGRSRIVTSTGAGSLGARLYDANPGELPLDYGFKDQRYAGDISFSSPIAEATKAGVGAGVSNEADFTAYYGNASLTRDFNQKNTTAVVGVNVEHDVISPMFGAPTPLTQMSAAIKTGDKSRNTYGAMAGVTQVMNRYWLAQLNYTISKSDGYQTDPYRVVSSVNATTGAPVRYLYESRPDTRLRQSLYLGNKVAIGPTVADLSVRGYHDDWGINSVTFAASERIPLTSHLYVEPGARYYKQSGADFFRDYLVAGQPTGQYASSDSRLSDFSAVTGSLRLGYKVGKTGELYLQADRYVQSGAGSTATAPGYLANRDLFSGSNASSVIVGYSFAFR